MIPALKNTFFVHNFLKNILFQGEIKPIDLYRNSIDDTFIKCTQLFLYLYKKMTSLRSYVGLSIAEVNII